MPTYLINNFNEIIFQLVVKGWEKYKKLIYFMNNFLVKYPGLCLTYSGCSFFRKRGGEYVSCYKNNC
jgi:hypothetical protein